MRPYPPVAPERQLSVAFVGCGAHATNCILPALGHVGIEIAAVCDIDEDRARHSARRFGAAAVYTDHRAMLAGEELDAVFVVGPPAMHQQVGIDVLRSGRHLFVEKPPAPTVDGALELQRTARLHDRQVMVGFMKRFALGYQRALELSREEEFGGIRFLKLNYSHWRVADLRDHLLTMSIHALDLAQHFLGPPETVCVYKRRHRGAHAVALQSAHARGTGAQLCLLGLEPRVQECLEVVGESAVVRVRNLVELEYLRPAPDIGDAYRVPVSARQGWRPDFAIPLKEAESLRLQGYVGEVDHFVSALLAGTPVVPGIDEGLAALRLAEAICSAPEGVTLLPGPLMT